MQFAKYIKIILANIFGDNETLRTSVQYSKRLIAFVSGVLGTQIVMALDVNLAVRSRSL